MKMLDFHNEIFLNLLESDGLAITAKGLGIEQVLINLINVYSDPKNLVLIIGTTPKEEDYVLRCLTNDNIKYLPKIITTEFNSNVRQNMYMEGGVLFVTSRILVVDLLTEKVPTDLITGIIVYRAHKIVESCQEAFILRLYRQKNKTGFIKALSNSPFSFTTGFCQVTRVMKNLFVGNLHLWPRFHGNVQACLEKSKPEVIELQLKMTSAMDNIQMAVLDLMSICMKELKRINPSIDMDELTVENAISKALDKVVKLQLDPVWHQLGPKTKNLISSLKMLRLLLIYLTQYDCVSFYSLINSIRSTEKSFAQNSDWLILDSAETMFVNAKQRVFGSENKSKKSKVSNKTSDSSVELETNPKWSALSEVVNEIKSEVSDLPAQTHILVLAEDDMTCKQLQEYLTYGSQHVLRKQYDKLIAGMSLAPRLIDTDEIKRRKAKSQNSEVPSDDNSAVDGSLSGQEKSSIDESKSSCSVMDEPIITFYPLKEYSEPYALDKFLDEFKPRYIIMCDADMKTVRKLEVYKAINPNLPMRVYFLVYEKSAEEQRYLTTLRKEKQAFEFLIKEKVTMVVPSDIEGREFDNPDLLRDVTPANETVTSRKGGYVKTCEQQKVIVDMREFRSELPSLIHQRDIDVEPVTLEIGDYILTPDICVERKSVSDLISSLNTGRLYNQAQAMCHNYKRPILLIEFDHNKSFSLQGRFYISNEMSSTDVSSKLILLTLHFPKLRMMWCPSPYATAELFSELKNGRQQPDTSKALSLTSSSSSEIPAEKYNRSSEMFVSKMPGVNKNNIKTLMNKANSLADLFLMTEEEIFELTENSVNSKALHEGINLATSESSNVDKQNTTKKHGISKHRRFKR